jgi:hypothetical protein
MRGCPGWRVASRSPIDAVRRLWWRGIWRVGQRSLTVWLRSQHL